MTEQQYTTAELDAAIAREQQGLDHSIATGNEEAARIYRDSIEYLTLQRAVAEFEDQRYRGAS